jgi:hypothetical protein
MNMWLFVVIQAVCSAILGFVGMVGVLTMGVVTGKAIIWCFVIGFILSFPVAWFIYKRVIDS